MRKNCVVACKRRVDRLGNRELFGRRRLDRGRRIAHRWLLLGRERWLICRELGRLMLCFGNCLFWRRRRESLIGREFGGPVLRFRNRCIQLWRGGRFLCCEIGGLGSKSGFICREIGKLVLRFRNRFIQLRRGGRLRYCESSAFQESLHPAPAPP